MKPTCARATRLLTLRLLTLCLLTACVDVPEPTQVGGAVDVGAGDGRLPDAQTLDRGQRDAQADAAPVDMALDAQRDDAALDMQPPDMQPPDMQPPDMQPLDMHLPDAAIPDIGVPDAAIDPDMGPPGPLAFSNCLPLAMVAGPQDNRGIIPCPQVAEAAPMPVRLSWPEAVALPDGRVVVVGGLRDDGQGGRALAAVQVYDPATNEWTPGPDLPGMAGGSEGRWGHSLAYADPVDGDAVVVLGGAGDTGGDPFWVARSTVLMWTVGEEEWVVLGELATPVALARAWSDGRAIWLIGGQGGPDAAPTAQISPWGPGAEVEPGMLTEARYGHGIVDVRGVPMVLGGAGGALAALNSAEIYSDAGWTRISDDALRRVYPSAVAFDDQVLVAGGRSHAFGPLPGGVQASRLATTAFIARHALPTWEVSPGPDMYRARFAFGLARIGDVGGYALAIGGEAEPADMNEADREVFVELFENTAGGRWWPFALPEPMNLRRSHLTAVRLADGTVFVTGGVLGGASPDDPELFMNQTLLFRLGERDVALPNDVP